MTQHSFSNLHVSRHPVLQDRLSKLRDKETSSDNFRKLLKEISLLLAYEVTADLKVQSQMIATPIVETMQASALALPEPVIVPILRAGLGLSAGLEEVLNRAPIGHIGVYRDEETKRPVEYLIKLPPDIAKREVILVDPMLATGHSMEYALDILVSKGVSLENIKIMALVAAPEGVEVLQKKYANIPIYAAALDDCLNENAYIVPGLGDAGDRYFGT